MLKALPRSNNLKDQLLAHLERFGDVVLLGVHETGHLGRVFRELEGRVVDVDALHSVLDVVRNASV